MRKIRITLVIAEINAGAIVTCPSIRASLTTLYLLIDMGFTHVSLEEK